MNRNFKYLILLLVSFTFAQRFICQDFGIGMWRDHLPYSNIIKVAKLDKVCFAASPFALFSVDELDETIERYTTVTGLSDFTIQTIGVNSKNKTLIIGYQNGNIDLIQGGRISNINAILKSNITGDKTIYNIHSEGNLSYLACGFGIVVLDISKNEVKDTYIIGSSGSQLTVYDIAINGDDIIAATQNGLYKAPLSAPFLADFNNWQQVNTFSNSNTTFQVVHAQNNFIYLINQLPNFADDTLKILDANYNYVTQLDNDNFFAVETKTNYSVLITQNYNVSEYDTNHQEVERLFTYAYANPINANHAIWDGNNHWVADGFLGLNKSIDNTFHKNYLLQGPNTNDCFQMSSSKDKIYVASGKVSGTAWNNSFNNNGVMSFDQIEWKTFNPNIDNNIPADSSFDFIYTSVNPRDENHALYCSFYGGLLEYKDGNFKARYSYWNSELSISLLHGNNQVKVSAAEFDSKGNIWAANSFTSKPLVLITPEGDSYSFSIGAAGNNAVITSMLIEKETNNIWLGIRGKGIVVYNYNNTPEDPSDDEFRLLTLSEGNGNLQSNNINTIVQDQDLEVWVGTDKGPVVFYSPSAIFSNNSNFDGQQVLLLQDGSYQYLLETQNISSILVDGANRKWFGTSSGGVFLMSEDGTEQINAFNTNNSPIFSNNVLSLAMNYLSGELFIGTDRGIIGYRGSATNPNPQFDDVYCFPNPVRPEFTGLIGIIGLMEDSDIKITDAAGQLVKNTMSLGGQAVWDGTDMYGNPVVTGIYFIFGVSTDGRSKVSTKVMIIR